MNISISSDHGGFQLKKQLIMFLNTLGYTIVDRGTYDEKSVDYPDYAVPVAVDVANQSSPVGIIIDGAGVGSSIVANKVPGVRAALCNDLFTAHNAKEHNNANILVLGSQVVGPGKAEKIVEVFLKTAFAGGRHERRVKKMDVIDQKYRSGTEISTSNQIEEVVTRIVHNFLDGNEPIVKKTPEQAQPNRSLDRHVPKLVTEEDVRNIIAAGSNEITVDKKTLITPLAHDTMREHRVKLIFQESPGD